MKHPLAFLNDEALYFVQDGSTMKLHLWSCKQENDPLEDYTPYLCGTKSAKRSEVLSVENALVGLRSVSKQHAIEFAKGELESHVVCQNCYRSLMKRLNEGELLLVELLELRWRACGKRPAGIQFGPPGIGKSLPVATSNKGYNVTTEIMVSIKIAYDLGELCPSDITDAVEDLKEKANEVGSVEEINLTTEGSLDVEVQL